jgi:hypothetical protein
MTDLPRTPLDVWLGKIPQWWDSLVAGVDRYDTTDVVPGHLDQASAYQRELWALLDVDVTDAEQRHALAVGLAYGARWLSGNGGGFLVILRGFGDLGRVEP